MPLLGDLPIHPLVVHAAVVLIPLSALALIAVILVRKWRPHYAWLAVGGTVVGALAAVGAKFSGQQLADQVGLPTRHYQMGTILFFVALGLAVSAVVWWLLQLRGRSKDADTPATKVLGIITAVLAVAALVLTVLAGHSGAESVWSTRAAGAYTGDATPSTTTEDGASEADASAESDTSKTDGAADQDAPADAADASSGEQFTLEEVAQNNTAESCWAVVDGSVYDLTTWISEHPGGSRVIERLCGTDATATFSNQHSGNSKAAGELDDHLIGKLAG